MRLLTFGGPLGLALLAALAPGLAVAGPEQIEVAATRIERFDATGATRFGALEFRGGVILSSTSPAFGGISGLTLDAAGSRFLAVTDAGSWLAGTIEADGDRPTGMFGVTVAPMLGPGGEPLAGTGRRDVESLTRTATGHAVGIERVQEIWGFRGDDPLAVHGRRLVHGGELAKLGSNQGIEGLAALPAGQASGAALAAVGEESPVDHATLPGFLFGPLEAPELVGTFGIERIDGFDATDLAVGDDGRVYLLERRFDLLRGVAMRIRRFALDDIRPGARLHGEVLIEANRLASIDNMEALALHRNAAGETILTLMSDNNFSVLQSTMLLRFAVVP